MNAVFVDTGGWMACADRGDPAHASCRVARDGRLEVGHTLITTDFVIDETLTHEVSPSSCSSWQEPLTQSLARA